MTNLPARGTVLVVDDDKDLSDSLVELLQSSGFAALAASNLAEAWASVQSHTPGIALVDLRLGRESGLNFIARIRSERPEVVAVVITGYAGIESAISALRVGAYDYLTKPVHPAQLFALMDRCLDKMRLEGAHRLASAVFETTVDGIVVTDPACVVVAANAAYAEFIGYPCAAIVGKPAPFLSREAGTEQVDSILAGLAMQGRWQGEFVHRPFDGESYTALLNISQVKNRQGGVVNYVCVLTDITQIKNAVAHIDYLAYHDTLTSLPNRRALVEKLRIATTGIAGGQQSGAVLFIDLDRFKNVNDGLGHGVGDQVLNVAGSRLRNSVGGSDFVARLGGDEFVVVLENIAPGREAASVAQRILRALETPYSLDGHEIYVTASIGIALFPADGNDPETLVKHADAALFQAKQKGRNLFEFYSPHMTANALRKLSVEAGLRNSLRNDGFKLVFQPIVGVESNEIACVEALVRWESRDGSLIAPDMFIPVAEETGLIAPLGEHVLRMACQQVAKWRGTALGRVKMAVNVSPRQFSSQGFARRFLEIVRDAGILPYNIEVEVTEKVFLEEQDNSQSALSELHEAGVTLALDDFGTGYSTVGCLKNYPFKTLKIDRSFLQSVTHNSQDEAMCRSIINLAHNLGLHVVGEGAETLEQLDYLRATHCDFVQGYFVGRPMSSAALLEWAAGPSGLAQAH